MDNDPIEAITEGAKAFQEVAKTGGKLIDASGRVGGWLDRLFGQGIEDTVALHWSDRIRARRIERAIYGVTTRFAQNRTLTGHADGHCLSARF
jgi:hypothetical protein